MRTNVALTIGAGVAGFALCAYIVTYATTRHEPVQWQNGDLIFQTSSGYPNEMVLDASASPLTNVGVVAVSEENGPTVIELGKEVDEISVRAFTAKGKDGTISVYRVRNLTPELAAQVITAARRYIGKPYDTFFDKGADNIYPGELVRLAFSEIGLMLGQSDRVEKYAKNQPGFEALYDQQWSNLRTCQSRNFDQTQCWAYILRQQVVMPSSIATDDHLALVYTDMPSVQALRPE